MTLTTGPKLGPYELLAPLGAGGMGEVYRARDPRLGREVAIKVLPASFSSDPDRLRRFEQEAKAAGVLNHPNITAVYDIGQHEGAPYVVQELLEGETLRSTLAGGRLTARKVMDYCVQTAHGLAAAHEKGIVHRDLKPENLFVTKDGRVKILDFGLAKLTQKEAGPEVSSLPTATAGTEPGVVLGTLGYMSPEQVRGKPADARSDIFCAILYEMLSGRRAFHGDSAADTMSAILKEDPPDLSVTNQSIPPGLERIVRHCLEKSPEQRFHSAHDLAFDLEALSGLSGQSIGAAAPARPRRLRLSMAATAAVVAGLLAAGGLGGYLAGSRGRSEKPPHWQRLTFRRGNVLSGRFAPDGRTVVYGAAWETSPGELFTARTDSTQSQPVGLSRADLLSISSKGELAVLLKKAALYRPGGLGTLARMPLGGGTPREVLEDVFKADWAPNGEDLAAVRRSPNGKLQVEYPLGTVLYEGGDIDFPRVSPDGDLVAFLERAPGRADSAVMTIDRKGNRRTIAPDWKRFFGLAWAPKGDGLIAAGSHGSLEDAVFALSLSGRERVLLSSSPGLTLHDVSPDGSLLVEIGSVRAGLSCVARGENRERELAWLDGSFLQGISNDGSAILFGEYGEAADPKGGVYLRRTDGSPAVRLGNGRGDGLTSDGNWALSWNPGHPAEFVLLPTGAGTPKRIPIEGVDPVGAFTLPRGKGYVVAALGKSEPVDLFVVGPEGGKPRLIRTEGLQLDGGGAVAPDGESLVYSAAGGQLKIASLSGGQTQVVPGPPLERGTRPVSISEDGRFLYVARYGEVPAPVERLELASGRRETWKKMGPEDSTGVIAIRAIHIAPDGRSYAYSYTRVVASDIYVIQGAR
jgi:eukaryotic-like serine/threonine-protein kinase